MLAEATQEGVFEPSEEDMVNRVFRLGDRRVSALMTHRTDVGWLDITDPPQEWMRIVTSSGFSQFPVARESLDNILGVVQAKDLLTRKQVNGPADLKSLLSPPVFVPESAPALELLGLFRESRQSIALVIDEHGGLEGLLTDNDVLEAIVGDLPEASQDYEPEAVARRDGSWLLDGTLPIDEFKEIFGMDELPGEARGQFNTLAGFVMAFLGRIPSTADHFQWNALCFEVMDMDAHRVDKILVTPLCGADDQCT
jgi:putative hemolysin